MLWFSKLPSGIKEVRSPLLSTEWPESNPRWLRVERVREPERPAPPSECQPWLSDVDLDDPAVTPFLNSHYTTSDEDGNDVDVTISAEAADLWHRYAETVQWTPWATRMPVTRAISTAYRKLFSIHQQLQGRADNFDLFLGIGLLDSRLDGTRVRRHLLTFPAELVLDDQTGALTLGPASDFVTAQVEVDFLQGNRRATIERKAMEIREDLAALAASLKDRERLSDVLRRLATPLSARAEYPTRWSRPRRHPTDFACPSRRQSCSGTGARNLLTRC